MTKVVAMLRSGLDLLGVAGTPQNYKPLSPTPFSDDRKNLAKDANVIAQSYKESAQKVLNESKKSRI